MKLKTIAIIPARGGSKGVPQKNIRLLSGKPLIAYTIDSALKSKYIDKVVVSTEDNEIATIANKFGAEVVERPEELATDTSSTIDVIIHALKYFENKGDFFEIVVLLQATSPLRNENDIDNAIHLFFNSPCGSVISVCEIEHSPYWCYTIEDSYLSPIFGEQYSLMRRQDLPVAYRPNGAIYITKTEIIKEKRDFLGSNTVPYFMSIEKSIDIDTELDFLIASCLINEIVRKS